MPTSLAAAHMHHAPCMCAWAWAWAWARMCPPALLCCTAPPLWPAATAPQVSSAITARARQLRRLRGVLRVVGARSLSELQAAWASGELSQQAGLSADDVEALLLSTAEDSAGRRAMLAALRGQE